MTARVADFHPVEKHFRWRHIDPCQYFARISVTDKADLTCIKCEAGKPFIVSKTMREQVMPIESVLVSVFVLAVFTGFALVLAWGERRTRHLETNGSQQQPVRVKESIAAE
jgi:hypothetical protein